MIEKIMKAVKRGNKKRSRNITIGAVIGFLLSCTAVMGADSYLWIKEDSGEIKFNTEKTTKVDGSDEGNWSTTNPYSDNNWNTETKTYTNNMTLLSSEKNGVVSNNGYNDSDISYGLRLSGNLTDVNFINNGSIKGEMSDATYNYGYGIHNSAKMGNIENTGTISGTGDTFGYGIFNSATMRKIENKNKGTISGVGGNTSGNGYGIANNSGTIEEITNAGTISGTGANSGSTGYGIDNRGTIRDITNTGEISGTGSGEDKNSGVGYGIDNSSLNSNIEGKITNAGVISGTGKSAGSGYGTGYGIDNRGTIKEITNTGEISGAGSSSSDNGTGYGIYNMSEDNKIGKIINTGIISGTGSSSSGKGIGSGIYNYGSMDKAIIEDITNAGIISGTGSSTSGNGTGYGIYNHSAKIENITNIGVMSGSGNSAGYGIYNIKDMYESTIGNIKNTGVISGYGTSTSGNSIGSGISNITGTTTQGNTTTIGAITNTGIISGAGISTGGDGEGYGIYNDSSKIGNIKNTGVISGYGTSTSGDSIGSGISNTTGTTTQGNTTTIGAITNTGIISGAGISTGGDGEGSGIYNDSSKIGSITNTGIISGTGKSADSGDGTGSGIYNDSSEIKDITNTGVISGYSAGSNNVNASFGIYSKSATIGNIENTGLISGNSTSGTGIWSKSSTIGAITNTGVIYGKTNAIKISGTIDASSNYGILVNGDSNKDVVDGLGIVGETPTDNQILNKGLIFTAVDGGGYKAEEKEYGKFGQTFDKDAGTRIINAAASGNGKDDITGTESLKLENGTLFYTDSDDTLKKEIISSSKRYILNGITNTLEVSEGNNELNNSVINAYGTAVVMDSDDSTLILNNTVVNGGLSGNDSVISITGNQNILTIQGNSVVNGEMESTGENNTLSLNGNAEDGMNMLHNISGFVNMNIDNNVTFFEDVKVKGTKKVTIAETGTLNLRLKNTGKEETVDGENIPKATHAFLGNEMVIQGEGNGKDTAGTLRFITNGIGQKIYVDMENIELKNLHFKTSSVIDGYDIKDKEYIILGAYGSLDGIYKPENTRKDSHRYEALNNIYKGLYSSTDDNLNALRVLISSNEKLGNNYDENLSDEEQLKNLLSYLGSIYAETPYSYSSELSRKSMGMFRDIVTENQFKPNLNQWLIMGGLTHRDGGTKDSYYGQNYHGFDTGTADVDVDMKLTGAYALGKYGYSENVSLGITAGGNRSEAKLPMSKVKGNSGYVGAFAENYRGNLTLKAGAGIQYSEYDADRATLGGHSYSYKYSDMTYDIYLNGRYSHNIGNNLFLEPYGTLSYTYVDQEGADEGSKVLAIETDSKSFDYTAAKVGVDLKKVIPHEKGKSIVSAGVSYTRLLTGADEENITGRFKGENATDFDILVAHKNEQSIGLNAKYALELESGILFDVKGSYSLERDSHNGNGKNRNKGEWIVGAGLGYKF